jgi:GDP-L-fucose synthase
MYEGIIENLENLKETDKILVTGGTGLYGNGIRLIIENQRKLKNLKEEKKNLFGSWFFISSKDGDLRDSNQCEKIFEKIQPTYVIHLAAFVGGLFRNLKYKVNFWIDNSDINNNVLFCCHKYKVKKCVSCLSTCVFPDKIEKYPFDETIIHDGEPHVSADAYAHSKRMLLMLGNWFNEQYPDGCFFTSVIPTNIFGPFDSYNINGHVISGLIQKCFNSKKENIPFTVLGLFKKKK